jgi:hypothetical protein
VMTMTTTCDLCSSATTSAGKDAYTEVKVTVNGMFMRIIHICKPCSPAPGSEAAAARFVDTILNKKPHMVEDRLYEGAIKK